MRITKPNRATHTYRQRLHAAPARVFPLLCPVRETEWANGWLPELVISSSGVAERDGIFFTPEKLGTGIWYITRHEPERWFAISNAIGYAKFFSRSHDAVTSVFGEAGNVIETHEHARDFKRVVNSH